MRFNIGEALGTHAMHETQCERFDIALSMQNRRQLSSIMPRVEAPAPVRKDLLPTISKYSRPYVTNHCRQEQTALSRGKSIPCTMLQRLAIGGDHNM